LPPAAAPTPPRPGSYPTFPTLIGQGWSVHYSPRFSTKTSAKVSGRETRAGSFAAPMWDIELTFDLLRSDPAYGELQEVIGFIGENAGKRAPFLFSPPGGLGVFTGGALGTGTGSQTAFIVTRQIGGYSENVQALMSAPVVYANGSVVSASAYTLSILPATITFSTAPAAGAVLTISFSAAHLARFVDDDLDLEQILSGFWQTKTLKLETVRA
jgi:hypothetical protein